MKDKFKKGYLLLMIMTLVVCTIGSTYAFWAATASSPERVVNTSSTTYSISMDISPLYSDFSFIPMDDVDILKGLSNQCLDKYGRGACTAYKIHIYGYNPDLNFISGKMDVNVNNIENLSYIMLEEKEEFDESKCVRIKNDDNEEDLENEGDIYCTSIDATPVLEGVGLSLGDKYDVGNTTEKNLLLLMWLSNLDESQNEKNIGNFNSIITFSMGSGGQIKGSISTVLEENRDKLQSEE